MLQRQATLDSETSRNGHHMDQIGIKLPISILKRDGRVVPFDIGRIENAMARCFASFGRTPETSIEELAGRVINIIAAKSNNQLPTVEGVQDIVEMVLQAAGEFEAAKRYILYRAEHAKKREERPIPDVVRHAFNESDQYFPTALQKFQFFDKYSRFNYELGRRETWLETVDRSVDFLYELAGARLPSETYTRIRQAILEMRAMPSMRLLAMAGAAARRSNIAIYNCLSGDEKILTHERGLIELRDAVGIVTVLNKNRAWVPAEVHSFGEQQTVEVEFGRYKSKKVIRATLNHNWVLSDGRRVMTEALQAGDEIAYTIAPRSINANSIDYQLGLMHGIVYGDGAETYAQERNNGYVIRLCGDSRELLEYFAGYPHTFPPTYGGDPVVYLYNDFAKTHHLKSLPNVNETDDYLVGFIRGWFAADGYLSKQGQILFAADETGEEFLRRVGPKVGFDFGYATLLSDPTNYGARTKKVRNVEMRRASVSEEDFILSKHIRNYREATTDRDWKFLGIVPGSMRVEEVFCAVVPDTHTFTLSDGVLTGNCSYQPVESTDSFVEALTISMSGCGVGYSVESRYVENFPRIRRQTGGPARTFVVEDSAEGWAEALRVGLETWFEGQDIQFDLSLLRAAGAPLRTKGGRASGPEPLRVMLDFVRARILARQGSFLRPIDAHDMMCAVGNAAVSGGVRRTAMISLFDYDDDEMRLCKNGDFERDNSQRWNANNSAIWPVGGLTQPEFIHQFLEMVESERGEPGIFNREAALNMRPVRRRPAEYGTNPCITGDSWVLTANGPRQVANLVGVQHTTIIDGQRYETSAMGFWETGVKQVLRLRTREGYTLRLTANHKVLAVPYISRKIECPEWVEAGSLRPGDLIKIHNHREFAWEGDGTREEGWLLGSLVGDGTFDHKQAQLAFWGEHRAQMAERAVNMLRLSMPARSDMKGHSQDEYDRTIINSAGLRDLAADYGIYRGVKTITPLIEQASSVFYQGFLQGLFDADGTVIGTQSKGVSVRLAQSDAALLEAAQRMLLRLGICSTIYTNRRPAGVRMLPDGQGSLQEYEVRADHELVIANDNLQVFAEMIGFSDPDKQVRLDQKLSGYQRVPNRERFVATIDSIEADGEEMVYDCSVPDINAFDANGLYVHNCGEIVLQPWQFCNLSAAVARSGDTFDTLREKVEIATIIGTIQSLATYFPGLRPQWQQNCNDERLLGVDITGQMDSLAAQDAGIKERLRHIAIEVNRQTSQELGINQSAAITCVKPSGNSSQFLDCASGLHSRWAPYYIRNVRVAAHSPVFKVLRDAAVPMDPENGQTPENANTWVIHFPVKAPEGAVTRKDRSAIAQCEYWLQNKIYWTEHNPSCFTGDTRIITDRGLMSFRQLEDYIGDDLARTPLVLGKDGRWVQAVFRSLGTQEIWEMVIERCGIRHTIRTTGDHLWPITSPQQRYRASALELRTTRELPVGSREYKLLTVNPREQIELDLEGILHGITFGDGTRGTGHQGRTRYCSVALCNDPNGVDSRELADLFIEAGYSPNIRDDMQQIQFYGLPEHWKQLPSADESPEYLRGFIAGWFAADGHIGITTTISSVRHEALEWLQAIAPRAGLATPTTIGEHHSESGVAPVTWYTLALVKETLDDDFFLLKGKREKFVPAKFAKYWKIVSVRNTGSREPVYCMEVTEADPYFVLEGNILTHNCTITYRPDEVIDLMKWVWEHRDQIGGLSFLPAFDAKYDNMPYVEITKQEYQRLATEFPEIDFSKIYRYEEEDLTNAAQELACSAGYCEVEF